MQCFKKNYKLSESLLRMDFEGIFVEILGALIEALIKLALRTSNMKLSEALNCDSNECNNKIYGEIIVNSSSFASFSILTFVLINMI